MEKLADNIWIVDGDTVQFLGLPFSTRMTVIRLADGALWIHSPIQFSAVMKTQIEELGRVKYLVAPNHLHHLFLAEWIAAFPDSKVYGTSEVIRKRNDISFEASLNKPLSCDWISEIDHELFSGSPLMEECVFFHRSSRTLIVTDLVENFSGQDFRMWQRVIAKGVGILAPHGKTPLDWRLSFMFGKDKARMHLKKMLSWQPRILVMAHGEIVKHDTPGFLIKSFSWLL